MRLPSLPFSTFLPFPASCLVWPPSPRSRKTLIMSQSKFRPQDLDHVMRSLPSTSNLLGGFDDLIDIHSISRLLLFMTPALKRKREDVSLPSSLTIEKVKWKVERCLPGRKENKKSSFAVIVSWSWNPCMHEKPNKGPYNFFLVSSGPGLIYFIFSGVR